MGRAKRKKEQKKGTREGKKESKGESKGMAKRDTKGNKRGKAKSLNARNVKNNRHSPLFVRGPFENVPEAPPTLRRHYATITGQFLFS